jgi:hypothetical protein
MREDPKEHVGRLRHEHRLKVRPHSILFLIGRAWHQLLSNWMTTRILVVIWLSLASGGTLFRATIVLRVIPSWLSFLFEIFFYEFPGDVVFDSVFFCSITDTLPFLNHVPHEFLEPLNAKINTFEAI